MQHCEAVWLWKNRNPNSSSCTHGKGRTFSTDLITSKKLWEEARIPNSLAGGHQYCHSLARWHMQASLPNTWAVLGSMAAIFRQELTSISKGDLVSPLKGTQSRCLIRKHPRGRGYWATNSKSKKNVPFLLLPQQAFQERNLPNGF